MVVQTIATPAGNGPESILEDPQAEAEHPALEAGRLARAIGTPRAARLCAVADTCDALARGAGTLFDPEIVPRFDATIREQAEEPGLDTRAAAGADAFGELVTSLQEDRGFP